MAINLKSKKPDMIRTLNEMQDVLYDQKWVKTAPNFEVYYVWRGVKPRRRAFGSLRGREKKELRYDVTIIPPRMLGKEFPKTKGHRHLRGYQELITVLEGKAFYLSQWGKNNKINKIQVVEARKGDWLIIPPDCDHLTINPTKKRLIMANWLSKKCKSDYSLFGKNQGAGYYYIKSGSRAAAKGEEENSFSSTWIKNKKYKKIPRLHFKKPLKGKPKDLDFLYGN